MVQDDSGVEVEVADGESLRAQYLVGCDGGRSLVRKAAGIEFPGWDPTISWLMTEAEMAEEPPTGLHDDANGFYAVNRLEDGLFGLVVAEKQVGRSSEPSLLDVSDALIAVCGTDYGIHSPKWVTRFTDMARQAAKYRERRVLLAGDTAHVHSPVGGQGLNLGVQDSANLGWKLAQVVKRTSPDSLLDTYHAERHPVGARVLRNNMAQIALRDRSNERVNALREVVAEILRVDEPRRRVGAMMAGLDIRYDLGGEHPLIGRRMPDLDLTTTERPVRVYALLHDARPVLLNFGKPRKSNVARWAERVQSIDVKYDGAWELPGLGVVEAPSAVLIRPDGYVAWVGDEREIGLTDALSTWFGPPSAGS